jgi:Tfp pilus assembly protein PilO
MNQSTKTALAFVVVIAMAAAFWFLLLSPKRDKASELGEQVSSIQAEVASEQVRAQEAVSDKKNFSKDYAELVSLGKAVPDEAATPSLLVQLNGLSDRSRTDFRGITRNTGGEASTESTEASTTTEGGTALTPIGASAGPAGLLEMPYQLQFEGRFFDIADFLHSIDSQVKTVDGRVEANGRLMTIDGFTLIPAQEEESGGNGGSSTSTLVATVSATTYVTPPGQGLTAGASSSGPAEETVAEVP